MDMKLLSDTNFFEDELECLEGILIYGIGNYGKKLTDYLIHIGKKEKIKGIIVTDRRKEIDVYQGIAVYDAKQVLSDLKNGGYRVIVATSAQYWHAITQILETYQVSTACYLAETGCRAINRIMDGGTFVPYSGIDFLVAGFMKCGTTSLYHILSKMDFIYLPREKETYFFRWKDKVGHAQEVLIRRYFSDIKEGQTVGMIEPSFFARAEGVYQHWGGVKIIFMMRNPVSAAFSLYKMDNRTGVKIFMEAYETYGCYNHESMFSKWIEVKLKNPEFQFHYGYWLDNWLKYFRKENIKVVFLEELLQEPQKAVSDILKFIGLDEKCDTNTFPRANEGDYVFADADGYRNAMELSELMKTYERTRDPRLEPEISRVKKKLDTAEKITGLSLSDKDVAMLKTYFDADVRHLEEILDKDLSEIWF